MKSVTISRSEIIVSNLLREQIELVRNIRDSNIAKGAVWDVVPGIGNFQEWTFLIENNFGKSEYEFNSTVVWPVSITKKDISDVDDFAQDKIATKFEDSKLCLDSQKRYTHDCTTTGNTETIYASYIRLIPMSYNDGAEQKIETEYGTDSSGNPIIRSQGYIIDARVITKEWSNYREYDARSAITDWQR